MKNKVIKISGLIIFLIILAAAVSFGTFTFLKNKDNRDNANNLAYLGIMEDLQDHVSFKTKSGRTFGFFVVQNNKMNSQWLGYHYVGE